MNRTQKAYQGFDRLAPFYDGLVRLVFGKAMYLAQTHFLSDINEKSKILILGGGTGWILKPLAQKTSGSEVTYIDAAQKMIAFARKQQPKDMHVTYITGTEEGIPVGASYDVIITNFYLDVFPEERIDTTVKQIAGHLKDDGIWIWTDFQDHGPLWQRLLIKIMYWFFRVTCRLEANALADFETAFSHNGFTEEKAMQYFHGMIKTAIHQRRNAPNA